MHIMFNMYGNARAPKDAAWARPAGITSDFLGRECGSTATYYMHVKLHYGNVLNRNMEVPCLH